jgi:large subunit ribosomal protein L22
MKEIYAISKYLKISFRKFRKISGQIVGLPVNKAYGILDIIPNKSAFFLKNTLKSAIANAENNFGFSRKNLFVKNVLINNGPSLKRFRPVSRGQAHPFKKRTSHITVIIG